MISFLHNQEKCNFLDTKNAFEKILAQKILNLLSPYHRGWHKNTHCLRDQKNCFDTHLKKIIKAIIDNKTILFVLPAFPAKSANKNKTEGPAPDLGEKLSLQFLNHLCEKIQSIYKPGAKIIICSDGRVFNDLVKVHDEDVNLYMTGIKNMVREEALQYIKTLDLADYFYHISYESMRMQLVQTYGESIEGIRSKIKKHPEIKILFNGIHRFIFEDELTFSSGLSRNQIRENAKQIAYAVIQRSNAWSTLIATHFPDAVRFSIHPQSCDAEKLGICFLKSKDQWATPWHRVVFFDGKTHWLIRRIEAESMGALPIYRNNQFSHYEKG